MDMTPHFPIYLDYSATNPCDERVVEAMIPWLREHYGNPASRSHAWGWEAEEAVEKLKFKDQIKLGTSIVFDKIYVFESLEQNDSLICTYNVEKTEDFVLLK